MIYQFDDYELDSNKFELLKNGDLQSLAPQAFDLLYLLICNAERLVTREEVIEKVWGGRHVSDTTVSSCLKSVRKILGDDGENQRFIRTSRGRGFQFIHPVHKKDDAVKPSKPNEAATSTSSFSHKVFLMMAGLLLIAVSFIYWINRVPESNGSFADQPFTIAVLPFADMSAEGDQEYFASGITEEILNVLARIDKLSVISRTTSFSLKVQNLSIPEVSELLGVKYVVEGSVRKSGSRVRVTAQLIDADTDQHLWSQNYDRELVDIFAIQDEIGMAIANILQIEIKHEDITQKAPTSSMAAYELYLKGHELFLNRGMVNATSRIGNLVMGIAFLEQAVKIDPNYALAWADIASSYLLLVTYDGAHYSLDRVSTRVKEAAEKALAIEPNLSQTWAVLGFVNLVEFRFKEAEAELNRAVELDPKNETAWLWLSLFNSSVGHHDEAIFAVEKAIELAPEITMNYGIHAIILHANGDVTGAEEVFDYAKNIKNFSLGQADLIFMSLMNNDKERALNEAKELSMRYEEGDDEVIYNEIATYVDAYLDPSKRAEARIFLGDRISEISRISSFIGSILLSDGEMLVRFLDGSIVNKTFYFRRFYVPMARPLFQQKVFRDYVINVGLLDYWKTTKFPTGCRAVSDSDFICE